MRHPRSLRLTVLALGALLTLLAAPPLIAAGYTIFLKDGSRLVAKEKYKVQNGRAIITLPNGTQTFVDAAQIDVQRTEEYHRAGHRGAVVLPGTPPDVGTPPTETKKEKTLGDLITSRGAGPRDLPGSRREKTESTGGLIKTKAGYPDFAALARRPYTQSDVAAELQQFFRGQGVEEVQIYQGTRTDHPLLEITANSEGSVFKSIGTAANALLHLRDLFPNRVAAFELLLTTPARERAGQFVLTPEMSIDLVSKKLDVTAFFVRNVQF